MINSFDLISDVGNFCEWNNSVPMAYYLYNVIPLNVYACRIVNNPSWINKIISSISYGSCFSKIVATQNCLF